MEKKGRPPKSAVRENIADMLTIMKKAYGYDIAKHYNNIYAKVTQRLIYYHLRKGEEYGMFKVKEIEKTTGRFSWGGTGERIMFELAKPRVAIKKEATDYFDKLYKNKN